MDFENNLLSALLFSPWFGIGLIFVFREDLPARTSAFLSSIVTFILSVVMLSQFQPQSPNFQMVELHEMIRFLGVNYHIGIDGISLFLVMASTFLTPVALMASWNQKFGVWQSQALILSFQFTILGSLLAMDLFLFYMFFELTLIPIYFLTITWGGEHRKAIAFKYILYMLAGSLMLLVGIIYLGLLYKTATGNWSFNIQELTRLNIPYFLQFWLFATFAFAFAVKTPLFPLHTWVSIYRQTPASGAVELGGLLIKLGPYAFLRFAIPLFPDAAAQMMIPFLVVAAFTILYGAWIASIQKDIKNVLAYSIVSHAGTLILGLFAFNLQAWTGSVVQMANQTIITSGLFLSAGMLYHRLQTHQIGAYSGVVKFAPKLSFFFLFFTLASIGLPGLSGFVGEILILLGAAQTHLLLAAVGGLGVIFSAVYMLSMYRQTMFGEVNIPCSKISDLNFRESFILLILAVVVLVIGVYPQPMIERIEPSVQKMLETSETASETSTFSLFKY